MDRIPKDHPRYRSLITREKLVAAGELVASAGLIAHGRGEAFDYLLGEKTTEPAHCAINAAAGLLCNARQPVISANGNTVALAGPAIAELATTLPARVEVNLFHRSSARVGGLVALLRAKLVERSSKGRYVAPRGQALLNNTAHALRPEINATYERLERY